MGSVYQKIAAGSIFRTDQKPRRKKRRTRKQKAVTPKATRRSKFYASREWNELRYKALKKNDGRCELCGRSSNDGARLHVDHIKPRSKFPELELVLDNLQVLCSICNYGKSNIDDTDWRTEIGSDDWWNNLA